MAIARHLELKTEDKLNPCRCGSSNLVLHNIGGIASYSIKCGNCSGEAQGDNYNGWEQTQPERAHDRAKATAIDAWNRETRC